MMAKIKAAARRFVDWWRNDVLMERRGRYDTALFPPVEPTKEQRELIETLKRANDDLAQSVKIPEPDPVKYHGRVPGYCGKCGQQTIRKLRGMMIVCDWCGWRIHLNVVEKLGGTPDVSDYRDRAVPLLEDKTRNDTVIGSRYYFRKANESRPRELKVRSIVWQADTLDITTLDGRTSYEPVGFTVTLECVGFTDIHQGDEGILMCTDGPKGNTMSRVICTGLTISSAVDELTITEISFSGKDEGDG